MTNSITWWREHRNSPGMDAASKRALLMDLKPRLAKAEEIRAGLTDPTILSDWDEMFADQDAELARVIAEIEESL